MRAPVALLVAVVLGGATPAPGDAADLPLHITADNMTGSRGVEGDVVLLNGNVRISRGRTVLTADNGRYERAAGMVYLEGSVELEDSTTTVTCDRASYSETRDVIELSGDVTLEDGEATLTAPAATYERRTGRAELYGGVEGSDREQRLRCERAIYHRDTRLLQARGDVRGVDDENRLELTASAIDYDRNSHEAVATGDPILRVKDDQGNEAVIRALKLALNTRTRIAEAIDSVRVQRDTLHARADYGLFDDAANRGWLLGSPRAWDQETSISGDTLEMVTEERELKRVVVRGNAVMDYRGIRPETAGETSRLSGERVDIAFTGGDIDSLVAVGKARNEYRGIARAGQTAETNLSQGDTITVFFENGEIDRARIEGGAAGEYQLATEIGDTLSAEDELVRYDATRISYIVSRNAIILDGLAHLVYRDLELTAKRVEYDIERQTLVAEGDPELLDRGDKVTGNLMTYDLESRIGNIYQAETAYEKGLYHGRRIRKVTDDQLEVLSGSFSTCELDEPHYHFAARRMKIYLKDKLVAKPVVFYVGKVPLLALPFWIFPIKPGRHSGFLLPQVEFGFSNQAGQFIRNAGYYWAPNDYMDLTLSGDYYQFQPSWIVRGEGRYKLLYVLDGNVRGSFARNEADSTENWDFVADHSQTISPRTRLVARASFVSSRDFNSSNLFGRSLSQRLNRFLTSSVALSHVADWASVNAILERREDLDADQALVGRPPGSSASLANLTQQFPSISVAFPTRTVGALGFLKGTALEKPLSTLYFGLGSRYVSQSQRRGFVAGSFDTVRSNDTVTVVDRTFIDQRSTVRRGFATDASLSDSRRLLGWLNVSPGVTGNFVIFDFDEEGNRIVPAGTWSSFLSTSTTLYGTFFPRLGPVQGLRHIVTPSASFSYSPEFRNLTVPDPVTGRRKNRFQSFGGIGISGFEQFVMRFGLDQRLQAKVGRGDRVRKLDNLLSWSLGGTYNFLYREQGQRHPISPIGSTVFLQPPGVLNASLSWVTNVYSPRPIQNLGYNLGFNLASEGRPRAAAPDLPVDQSSRDFDDDFEDQENWSVDLAFSYSGGYERPNRWASSQTANVVLRYQLTPGWGIDYSASYDVTTRAVDTQQFALTRDLHCWQAVFTRTFAPDGEAEYYFRLGVKDQREIYLERGTRGGSIGGIQ